ncbi:MAG: hypothetical protein Q8P91_03345 [bacterium]|nr:hypothetical protein [bacterium]
MPKHKRKKLSLLPFLLTFVILIFVLFIFFLKTSVWDSKGKFILAVNRQDDVLVSVFDPETETIVSVSIPQNVQVVAAGELGTWKLGSLWELGHNEKQEGNLLSKTVTKNFAFPVYAWGDYKAAGFTRGNYGGILSAILGSYKTSLKIGDKIRLGLFVLGIGSSKRTVVDLADINESLRRETFLDGSEGFVIKSSVPDRIIALFSDEVTAAKNYKARFVLKSKRIKSIDAVSRVIEVMGIKVASIVKDNSEDINCIVLGEDKKLVKSIALVLGCVGQEKKIEGSFDIEVILGEQFNKHF